VGDLVGFAPSRLRVWDYDGYYYPHYPPMSSYASKVKRTKTNAIGIIVEIYEKYGYYSSRYYKVKWSDNGVFSNEKHEDLILISQNTNNDKE